MYPIGRKWMTELQARVVHGLLAWRIFCGCGSNLFLVRLPFQSIQKAIFLITKHLNAYYTVISHRFRYSPVMMKKTRTCDEIQKTQKIKWIFEGENQRME